MKQYETVIGLEVHVELATASKVFCACSTEFGKKANTNCCPVCTGMPGSLPVLNKKVVDYAIAAGLALNCTIRKDIVFDRKNYFYPDLPKSYQISQLYLPIAYKGGIKIDTKTGKKTIGIREIHIEEDAGKLIHDEKNNKTLVDYNRAGVGLIEIVSEPDMRSVEEVMEYLDKLKLILQYLGISDCKMQEGSLRVDINLSVREFGSKNLGTRTEMKNLNSFKAIRRAIEAESIRQVEVLEAGGSIVQETRRWDDNKNISLRMRTKEEAQDYRYFPEPDLVPLKIWEGWIDQIKASLPELREDKIIRYQKEYNIPQYDAMILTSSKKIADLFEATTSLCDLPKEVSNWLMVEGMRILRENEIDPWDIDISPEKLSTLIIMVEENKISRPVAKEVFEKIIIEDVDPKEYIERLGLGMVSDDKLLRSIIVTVLKENPKSVSDYKNGKTKAIGNLVGQTMKAMKGKADPLLVYKILREFLD